MNQHEKYRVDYVFNNSKLGFTNSVTVMANDEKQAYDKARMEVIDCYGSGMANKFTYKQPIKL